MSSTKRDRFFLIDCNQFFVSCEQVFDPKLKGKPVVVLSSNDGCIVARSKEAKALKIPMGAPAFQYQELFRREKVHVLSSNFSLYSDMSHRVMHLLSLYAEEMEEYSIDEAFLKSSELSREDAKELRKRIAKWTGIPVSIGIGQTKTLAKLASDLAKKREDGVFAFEEDGQSDALLSYLPVHEVWGIGTQLSIQLRARGIDTVLALKRASDAWIKKRFSVTLLKTVWELRGISCLDIVGGDEIRKSITCSRSFGMPVTSLEDVQEALSRHTASAAEKLRSEGLMACTAAIFLMTSKHRTPCYANQAFCQWEEPTHYTPFLIDKAKKALNVIYRPNYLYKKVGITLGGITVASCYQRDFFSRDKEKYLKAMSAYDAIHSRFGKDALYFAAEGSKNYRISKSQNVSARFTTSWDDLLIVS